MVTPLRLISFRLILFHLTILHLIIFYFTLLYPTFSPHVARSTRFYPYSVTGYHTNKNPVPAVVHTLKKDVWKKKPVTGVFQPSWHERIVSICSKGPSERPKYSTGQARLLDNSFGIWARSSEGEWGHLLDGQPSKPAGPFARLTIT